MEKKKPIIDTVIDKFIARNYENSGKLSVEDAIKFPDCESYYYDELSNTKVRGYPFASDFVDRDGNLYTMNDFESLNDYKRKELRLRYHYLPKMHEIYIGTTGSGKTTGCVEPQIRALVTQANKPNLFLTDPKGEIYNHSAEYIKSLGYDVYVLNFKDIRRTDRWNPIGEIYNNYMEINRYKKKPKSKFEIDGIVFNTIDEYVLYCDQQISVITSEVDSEIKQFVDMIIPVKSKNDVAWEQGSQTVLEGIILLMLDLAADEKNTGFTKDMFTINTIFSLYDLLKIRFNSISSYDEILEHPLIHGSVKAANKLSTVFANTERTRRNYYGVFEGVTRDWRHGHIFALTTGNTINFEKSKKPFAIFVITRDYEKSDFQIAGLFIDFTYRTLVKEAEEKIQANKPVRATHFMLDEFGNIPKIPNFDNKIATSRSRNIWMHLFLQSYEQLKNVYTSDCEAEVILSNCNNHIFLGSQSYSTIKQFVEECGKTAIDIRNITRDRVPTIVEKNVIRFSDLDLIETGSMYVKRIYTPVIYSHFIRSYFLGDNGYFEMFRRDGLLKVAPYNDVNSQSVKYTYVPNHDRIKNPWDDDDF